MSKDVGIDPGFAEVLAGRGGARGSSEESTAEAILRAAEELFLDLGFHATRVSEVARLADVSIGSIYVHYGNKEGLYAALVERALNVEAGYLDAVLDDDALPDLEKVVALGEAYLQFFRDHPAYFRLLMMPIESIPEEATGSPLARQVARRGASQRERLAAAVRRCIEQGVMRDDVEPERVANFWWAAWNGVVALTLRSDDLAIDQAEMEQVVLTGRLMIAEGLVSSSLRDPDGRIAEQMRERLASLREAPDPVVQ